MQLLNAAGLLSGSGQSPTPKLELMQYISLNLNILATCSESIIRGNFVSFLVSVT